MKIATDVTPPRSFDAKSMGNGIFRVTFTPVPPESEKPVDLRVLMGRSWIELAVPDHVVRVGRVSLQLSDLQQLMANPPRVITRKGQIVLGPISNLGKGKVATGRKGKPATIDLSQASVIQVSPSAATKPLGAIEAVVELQEGRRGSCYQIETSGVPRCAGALGRSSQGSWHADSAASPSGDAKSGSRDRACQALARGLPPCRRRSARRAYRSGRPPCPWETHSWLMAREP